MIHVETFTLGMFQVHTYVLWDDNTRQSVIIDAGLNPQPVLAFLQREGLSPQHLFLTHAHIDHVEGHAALTEALPGLRLYMHPEESFWLDNLALQANMFHMQAPAKPTVDVPVADGDSFAFDTFNVVARHAPGHAPGSICYHVPEAELMFVGDVIFAGSIGRTDFPKGDHATLLNAIDRVVLSLPDATRLYPGHGPSTTVGVERRSNPFLVG
jgi:hydroxyacylglutathione hydrolase